MYWIITYAGQFLSHRFRKLESRESTLPLHFILTIANHFEPGWREASVATGLHRVNSWIGMMNENGSVRDFYGSRLRHSYFFPVEQYEKEYLELLSDHCREGFGEIEVHLHHGVDRPDSAENLRRSLEEYLARLRTEHGWSVQDSAGKSPCYAFVHGNWALANSAGGHNCGVDEEIAILRDTGCYVDMTMPSAPDKTQVSVINSIYTPSLPLTERACHRRGKPLRVGIVMEDPIFFMINGPLLINWGRRKHHVPLPRIENGELSCDYLPTLERFRLWASARIHVLGRPEWIFIKLHCHGLQERSLRFLAGDTMSKFAEDALALANDMGARLHFVTAREMANVAYAAVNGAKGDPDDWKNFSWRLVQ